MKKKRKVAYQQGFWGLCFIIEFFFMKIATIRGHMMNIATIRGHVLEN